MCGCMRAQRVLLVTAVLAPSAMAFVPRFGALVHGRPILTRLFSSKAPRGQTNERPDQDGVSLTRHLINWYPGHIAKAERELKDFLKAVDVVIEARDARLPTATTHPMVRQWIGKRPLIVAMTRRDMVPSRAMKEWQDYYVQEARLLTREGRPKSPVVFVDAKQGTDIHRLKMITLKAGAAVNERRKRLGLLPRSIRAAVIGYPNVGKSAIINKLLGKKMAKSKNMPGVTRRLQWIRLGAAALTGPREEELELLDSPGIIPAKQVDQNTALKLAVCNDIGQASYDVQVVAAELIEMLKAVHAERPSYIQMDRVKARYDMDPLEMSGDEFLYEYAQANYRGNLYSAADKILGDFRRGVLGQITLEVPPSLEELEQRMASKSERRPAPASADEADDVDWGEGAAGVEGESEGGERKEDIAPVWPGRGQTVVGVGDFEGW